MQWESQLEKIKAGDRKTLARFISVIENEQEGGTKMYRLRVGGENA